jgi:hypothetical protein
VTRKIDENEDLWHSMKNNRQLAAIWVARAAVGLVFAVNIECALVFILQPQRYFGGFEVSGVPGELIVQSFGILFLMWNATYPLVVLSPHKQRTLYGVILAQQCIGLLGETWLLLKLPAGHPALYATGLRFIVFDGFGLLIMGLAFLYLNFTLRAHPKPGPVNDR